MDWYEGTSMNDKLMELQPTHRKRLCDGTYHRGLDGNTNANNADLFLVRYKPCETYANPKFKSSQRCNFFSINQIKILTIIFS